MTKRTFPCPACDELLTTRSDSADAWLFCETNGGVALREGALRKKFGDEIAEYIWTLVGEAPVEPRRDCPDCGKPMAALDISDEREGLTVVKQPDLELDACTACRLVWFDRMELNQAEYLTNQPSETAELASLALIGWPGFLMLRFAAQQRKAPGAKRRSSTPPN